MKSLNNPPKNPKSIVVYLIGVLHCLNRTDHEFLDKFFLETMVSPI